MSKHPFVDFKAVKAAITMEQALQHYGLLDQFKRSGDSLSGPCPIHKGSNPTQFRVSVSKNLWNCFSECNHGGNVLDFISRMEGANVYQAALKAIEWFGLDPEAMSGNAKEDGDDAGRLGREEIAVHLSRFAFVRVHVFEEQDKQPEHLTAEEVAAILA